MTDAQFVWHGYKRLIKLNAMLVVVFGLLILPFIDLIVIPTTRRYLGIHAVRPAICLIRSGPGGKRKKPQCAE